MLLTTFAAGVHCWLMLNLLSIRTPRFFSAKLFSSQSDPEPIIPLSVQYSELAFAKDHINPFLQSQFLHIAALQHISCSLCNSVSFHKLSGIALYPIINVIHKYVIKFWLQSQSWAMPLVSDHKLAFETLIITLSSKKPCLVPPLSSFIYPVHPPSACL